MTTVRDAMLPDEILYEWQRGNLIPRDEHEAAVAEAVERERAIGEALVQKLYDVADGSEPCVGGQFEVLMMQARDYLGKSLAQMQAEKS